MGRGCHPGRALSGGHRDQSRRAHQQHLDGGGGGVHLSLGFRFYAKFIAAKVMALDDKRATPAERLRDGHDYEPTNKWIVFGHHFAAIAGPGPLVGPTLAAQFGYLPGTLWIIIGAVLAGAVQDFVILFCSMRRDGKSLGQMAREEIGKVGGFTALLTVLLIMIILLAVVALVVVNALEGSPWGTFTIAATMPIAVFMGLYLRYWRPGKVLECSALGFVLVLASIFGGQCGGGFGDAGAGVHAVGDGARGRDHHLWILRQRAAGVAAARAARLSEHVREARRGGAAGAWAFCSCGRNCRCRRSRALSTAPGRSSRARFSRSASSRSRAARSRASTR